MAHQAQWPQAVVESAIEVMNMFQVLKPKNNRLKTPAFALACLYFGLQKNHMAPIPKELVKKWHKTITEKEFRRNMSAIGKEFREHGISNMLQGGNVEDYVIEIISKINGSSELETFAKEIARRSFGIIEGYPPLSSRAGAAVLLAAKKAQIKVSEEAVAVAASKKMGTLKNYLREMEKNWKLMFRDDDETLQALLGQIDLYK